MIGRKDRLKRLVVLQGRVKELHEMRHAAHIAAAAKAGEEAEDLARHAEADQLVGQLFPGLHARRIAAARSDERQKLDLAAGEAARIAREKARLEIVAKRYREAAGAEERQAGDKAVLEAVERDLARR